MPRSPYEAVVAVQFQLPAMLRLSGGMVAAWEPEEGECGIHVNARLGELRFTKRTDLAEVTKIGHANPPFFNDDEQSERYRIASLLDNGERIFQAEVYPGANGGFSEIRPFSDCVVFLALKRREQAESPSTLERAVRAVNSLVQRYRLSTMDYLARPLRIVDIIQATMRLAILPPELKYLSPFELVRGTRSLDFYRVMGQGKANHLGLNSLDAVRAPRVLNAAEESRLVREFANEFDIPRHLEFVLSAIRRLRRAEFPLAIVDAQTGLEVYVSKALRRALLELGHTDEQIDKLYERKQPLHSLWAKLKRMDEIAAVAVASVANYVDSPTHVAQRNDLSVPRNRIVHGGRTDYGFDDAKKAIVAALGAIAHLNRMHPSFDFGVAVDPALCSLDHIEDHPYSLFRLFQF